MIEKDKILLLRSIYFCLKWQAKLTSWTLWICEGSNIAKLYSVKVNNKQLWKEFSLYHKLECSDFYISVTWWCKPLIFQTELNWSNRINSLDCKNIRIRKSEFLAKTQLLCKTSQIYEESFKIHK